MGGYPVIGHPGKGSCLRCMNEGNPIPVIFYLREWFFMMIFMAWVWINLFFIAEAVDT